MSLARRLEAPFAGDPWPLYRRISAGDPVPCGAYLELGSTNDGPQRALLSASPERFVALSAEGLVATDPIKGTGPRGTTVTHDRALRRELLVSPKDRAENVMIVDVLRNDLGRVCVPVRCRSRGSADLSDAQRAALVSRVVGRSGPSHDPFDLLAAAFQGNGDGRSEDPGDGDHRGDRAGPSRPVHWIRPLDRCRRRHGIIDSSSGPTWPTVSASPSTSEGG